MNTLSKQSVSRLVAVIAASMTLMLGLSLAALPQADAQTADYDSATPVCIESDFVQDDASTVSLQVGFEYMAEDGQLYVITDGDTSCMFNCDMGFDANCDDVLGDYCPVELFIKRVGGAAKCLAALDADAVATTASAAPIPVAGGLAHTGAEANVLAYAGVGLLGFGALAVGTARRHRR